MFPLLSVCNKVYQPFYSWGGGGVREEGGVGIREGPGSVDTMKGVREEGGVGIKTIQCIAAEEIHIRINFSATDSCCNSYSFISLKKTNVRKR